MAGKKRRIVDLRVLPGEPTDGSGRVCIHLFVHDDRGVFVEPHALHPVFENGQQVKQKVMARPTRGRLACDPKRSVAPVTQRLRSGGSVTIITHRTDDWQAVTCPKCIASKDYKEAAARAAQPQPAPAATQ